MSKKIFFVRHGESEANVRGVAAGSEMDSPLTENGRAQAHRAGGDLKNKDIDLIVCSPMQRTMDTATLIAKEIGYDPRKILQQIYFTERGLGEFSNKPHSDYRAALLAGTLSKSVETTEEMHNRVIEGFTWLKSLDARNIVIVSHGGTGRIVKIVAQKLHHSQYHEVDGFGNTEIFEFELED